ncbi:PREDICTED: MAP7 domain-containing protein 3 [Chinchilla lanigera]|uniref:MAP7 domain-containing protein 3 n=1 Tax=Chinchilla lanigera TaxID=34839 RepID=UPI0006984045|nr:PREDICTED: MAP7 domain-containing protein 3 [Chinchilla lanigera]
MADRGVAGGGGSTSLRGLRERMVAEAQAMAEERRSQSGVSSLSTHSPSIRSTVKPVIDGSVLKNDIKQKLAKERREEKKRQEEANKELQLLEKERKARLQYEKNLEEKQRKLKEQKEKDERRRVSAEEKRKQKLEEERERHKAALSRTLERSNRMDQRQKRWSWEGLPVTNSENNHGKSENKRSSSLSRRDSKIHSSNDTGHTEDKPAHHFHNNTPENNLISRLLIPTKASVARSKSAASLSIPGKESPGLNKKFILQYVPAPLQSHSNEVLKTSSMHCKSAVKMPPQTKVDLAALEKVETPLKAKMKTSPTSSSVTGREELPKVKLDGTPRVSVDITTAVSSVSSEATPAVSSEATSEAIPAVSSEAPTAVSSTIPAVSSAIPAVSFEANPTVSWEAIPAVSSAIPSVSWEAIPAVSSAIPSVSWEAIPSVSWEAIPTVSWEGIPTVSWEATPGVYADLLSLVSTEAIPGVSGAAAAARVNIDTLTEVSMDTASEVSTETSPLSSVEASPVVSLDTSPEVSTDASPVASVDFSLEGSIEASPESMQVPPEANVEVRPRADGETGPITSVQESRQESGEAPPEVLVEATPQASVEEPSKEPPKKPEMDKQTTNPFIKKRPSGNIPRYKWPASPTKERRPPSPITATQSQKNRPPSPSPLLKYSSQPSLSYKITPVHRTLLVPNALGTFRKRRETISKTTNEFEAMSQKYMIHEESGNKSTPGTMSAEEATKILAEKRRLAREEKGKKEEERLQKEVEERKVADVSKKMNEAQVEECSRCEARQHGKDIEKNKNHQPQEYQGIMEQKGDAKIKAHEEADKRKKEHERIMLQNLQERLERKKRIEEIMKRTRKTDADASKAIKTSGNNPTEEDEAEEEEEIESDEGSLDDTSISGIRNNGDPSTQLTVPCEYATGMPQKPVLSEAETSEVSKEQTAHFNGSVKTFRQEDPEVPSNQAKSSKLPTKRTSIHTEKYSKGMEAATSTQSTQHVTTNQDRICDQVFDFAHHNIESPATDGTPSSCNLNPRDSTAAHQSPQTPPDCENRSKRVSAQSDM